MRILVVVLLLWLMAAAARAADETADSRAIKDITLDLSDRITGGVLPFDEPFLFKGVVSERVTKIKGKYTEVMPSNTTNSHDKALAAAGVVQPHQLEWIVDPVLTVRDSNGKVPFTLFVPPLEAKRYYVFEFDYEATATSDQETKFRNRIRPEIVRTFTELNSLTIPDDAFVNLQTNLQKAVQAAAGDGLQVRVTGTIFDPNASQSDIDPEFLNEVIILGGTALSLKKQFDGIPADQVPSYATRLTDADNALRAVQQLWQKIAGGITIPDDHKDIVTLFDRPLKQLGDIAQGAHPDQPTHKISLLQNLTAAELEQRENGYRETLERLAELRNYLQRLESAGTLKKLEDAGTIQRSERTDATASNGTVPQAERKIRLVRQGAASMRNLITARDAEIDALVARTNVIAVGRVVVNTSTLGTYDTFAPWHVATEAGLLYAPGLDAAVPYVGSNFYFRPVNRDVPLSERGGFLRRFSASLALTADGGIGNATEGRSNLFGDQSLLVGAGYRITDIFRVGGGGVIFKRNDPNPFETGTELDASYYVSLGFDFRLAKTFQGIMSLFD